MHAVADLECIHCIHEYTHFMIIIMIMDDNWNTSFSALRMLLLSKFNNAIIFDDTHKKTKEEKKKTFFFATGMTWQTKNQ